MMYGEQLAVGEQLGSETLLARTYKSVPGDLICITMWQGDDGTYTVRTDDVCQLYQWTIGYATEAEATVNYQKTCNGF